MSQRGPELAAVEGLGACDSRADNDRPPEVRPDGDAVERAPGCTRPLRILVVDDEHDTADTTRMFLEALGHRARVVYDGAAALAAVQEEPADVVLLDLAMPGMNGLVLARRLRALPGMAGALLVCISGYGRETDRDSSRAAGCDVHLAPNGLLPPDT